jgi:phage replication-related protein YjqB (UPF0714/DUF867 family)
MVVGTSEKTALTMADIYRSFEALAANEREGTHWRHEYVPRASRVLVMAPHGGWIEPFTSEVARAVAGGEFSLYTFEGIGPLGSHRLHLTSHRFDDPLALRATEECDTVLAVHGEQTQEASFAMVGGGWRELRDGLGLALEEAGFEVRDPRPGLRGENPRNICNRGRLGAGAQLEISEGLRELLRRDTREMAEFVDAVRGVLLELEGSIRWETTRGAVPDLPGADLDGEP